jgi:hypothetical protein
MDLNRDSPEIPGFSADFREKAIASRSVRRIHCLGSSKRTDTPKGERINTWQQVR